MSLQLRSYQQEAINSIFQYFYENSTGHPLIGMPGGSGKAIVIAGFIIDVFKYWPNQRILQLVHTKELVEQNAKKLVQFWPFSGPAPVGVYCAGLNRKDTAHPVIFGSLGSVRNNIESFGHRDILIVDEAHCISPDEATGYQKIIAGLTAINPNLRVVGLSATNYRLGQGLLTNDGLFTDVCFDITKVHHFNRLIAEGYLSPLLPKPTNVQLDLTGVSVTAGDYNQGKLQKAVDKQEITFAAIKEAMQFGYDRRCWKVFCSGVEHCEHTAEILQSVGITSTFIHSKISEDERDERFDAFKTGKVQALCTYKIATTGFDHPPIDLIIDLYPTVSPAMHVQKYSRGTRPYDCNNTEQYIPGFEYVKHNCLVLDFANNTRRLGPINDPMIPKKKGDKTGEVPIKICENCGLMCHASARYCGGVPEPSPCGCGHEFKFKTKLVKSAGTEEIIRSDMPVVETYNVTKVIYHRHQKIGSKPCMKVTYWCGLQSFKEYVAFEALGFARTRAAQWWMQRHESGVPATTDDALVYMSQLRMPRKIHVRTDTKYHEIMGVEW